MQAFLSSPSIQRAVELLDAADLAMERIRDFKRHAQDAVVDYILQEGAFAVGDRVFCVANESATKHNMTPEQMFENLMHGAQGDLSKVVSCLRSDAFKPSEVKKIVPIETYQKMFVKVQKVKLDERDGTERVMKKLVRADRRFLPNVPVRGEIVDDALDTSDFDP